MKYLGMWLDPLLNFTLHVKYAKAMAKRAAARICNLFDGCEGISIQLGVQLYKSLVRPHLEYAALVWASANTKDLDKLNKLQIQCLRRTIGAKSSLTLFMERGRKKIDATPSDIYAVDETAVWFDTVRESTVADKGAKSIPLKSKAHESSGSR